MESKVCSRSQGQPPGARKRSIIATARSKRSPVVDIGIHSKRPLAVGATHNSCAYRPVCSRTASRFCLTLPFRNVRTKRCVFWSTNSAVPRLPSPTDGGDAHSKGRSVSKPGFGISNPFPELLHLIDNYGVSGQSTNIPGRSALSSGGDRRGYQRRGCGAAVRARGKAYVAGGTE